MSLVDARGATRGDICFCELQSAPREVKILAENTDLSFTVSVAIQLWFRDESLHSKGSRGLHHAHSSFIFYEACSCATRPYTSTLTSPRAPRAKQKLPSDAGRPDLNSVRLAPTVADLFNAQDAFYPHLACHSIRLQFPSHPVPTASSAMMKVGLFMLRLGVSYARPWFA